MLVPWTFDRDRLGLHVKISIFKKYVKELNTRSGARIAPQFFRTCDPTCRYESYMGD